MSGGDLVIVEHLRDIRCPHTTCLRMAAVVRVGAITRVLCACGYCLGYDPLTDGNGNSEINQAKNRIIQEQQAQEHP